MAVPPRTLIKQSGLLGQIPQGGLAPGTEYNARETGLAKRLRAIEVDNTIVESSHGRAERQERAGRPFRSRPWNGRGSGLLCYMPVEQ